MKGVKIGIIGVGHAGAHVMYSIALQGLADEILIVDTDEKDEEGELISAYFRYGVAPSAQSEDKDRRSQRPRRM